MRGGFGNPFENLGADPGFAKPISLRSRSWAGLGLVRQLDFTEIKHARFTRLGNFGKEDEAPNCRQV